MKRLLVIVNPYATTVSSRLKTLVVYALRGSYRVDAVDTERRRHATELCREAAASGDYDACVAFGGDGTVNEAANGLAGSQVPLICLPGGRVNVYCRLLGIPGDVVDATEHVLGLADDWHPRPVDLGVVNGRYFVVNSGVGLDAAVVQRVDAHPRLKARVGEYYYAWAGASIFSRRFLARPPKMSATLADGTVVDGVSVFVQNTTPYTYFGARPVQIAEDVTLDSGDLAGVVLRRTSPLEIPTITWRLLSARARISRHRQIDPFAAQAGLIVRSREGKPLPVQVDGDYIGTCEEAVYAIAPHALTVVA